MSRRVSNYEVVREIGRGANAVVYLARHVHLNKLFALKELRIDLADETAAARFRHEAQLAASLTHPNIVVVHDYFEDNGTPYIVMEYLERGSLRPLVGGLTPSEIFTVLEGLLAGLACADRNGVVHRDLKPENLMLTELGQIKIADFGIAKASATATTNLTRTGLVVGAPAYMAPEQAKGEETGPAADLYSAGIIAYELVTGAVPYSGGDPMSILWRHVHEPLPPVVLRKPGVDVRLAHWIERLLEKEPSRRPAGAREALDELRAIWDKVLERPRPARPPRRIATAFVNPLNLAVALMVALAAVVLNAIWLVAVAGIAYGALVVIGYVSAPTRAAETRDRTRERPRRERELASRSFDG
jgi:serine/threonine protein kinase